MPTIDPPIMKVTPEALKPMKASYVVERYYFEEDRYELVQSYGSLPEALAEYPKLFKELEPKKANPEERELLLAGLYRIRCELDVVVATNH